MGWLLRSFNTSIGKKFIMALTGLMLIIFLTGHLAGNLALFANDGGVSFNAYAAMLRGLKFIYAVELGLALVFVIHIINGTRLWLENKKARPVQYKVKTPSKGSSLSSRTMIQTGSIVFIFLVVHLKSFWYTHTVEGHDGTIYDLVVEAFSNPYYSAFYVIAMGFLAFHLNHGFQSAFQTLGLNHSKYFPFIKKLGTVYAIVVSLAFAAMPIYFLLKEVM